MKLILSILLIISLGGCYYLYSNMNAVKFELAPLKSELIMAKDSVAKAKNDLVTTQNDLSSARNNLTATWNELEAARRESASAKNALDAVNKELASTKDTLKTTRDTLATVQGITDSDKLTLKLVQAELASAKATLKLYEDTYGKVYSGIQPPVTSATGANIRLVSNVSASNPTWEQVKNFLQEDLTDEKVYDTKSYDCVDYATDLYNNAQAKGIKAAFVTIKFKDSTVGHALNAFKTTDQGLFFIDMTGTAEGVKRPKSMDTTARVKIGMNYLREFVFQRGYYVENGLQILWYFKEDPEVTNIAVYW